MKDLYEKYFSGTISPEQEKQLWSYILKSPENAAEFREADRQWDDNPGISCKLRAQFNLLEKKAAQRQRRSVSRRMAWISAIASCLAVAVSVFAWQFFRTKTETFYAFGETKDIVLPDGSIVNMNKESELTYSFNRKSRKITLDGEAFFDVARNEDKPFTVNTSKCNVTVLGTKFNVTDYSTDSNAQVILAEGSLKLSLRGEEDILVKGDKVVFDGEEITRTKVDGSEAEIWKSGAISFERISLDDFLHRVSREYGVKVELEARGFARKTFRASFVREESVNNILESVCQIFPLYIEEENGSYYLKFTINN